MYLINPYVYAGAASTIGSRPFVNASLVSEFTDGAPGTISLIPLALKTNDYVIVAHAVGASTDRAMSNASGWSELTELWGEGASYDANLAIYHKRMGATPDSSITIDTTSSLDGGAVIIFAVRGVNETTAFDVTTTTATGASGNTQGASITPTTQNSLIIVAGCTGGTSGLGDYATPADLANFRKGKGADTSQGAGGMGSYDWVSGAFTPNGWAAANDDGWAAVTMALRPRFLVSSDTRTTTGGDTRVTTGGDTRISEVYS